MPRKPRLHADGAFYHRYQTREDARAAPYTYIEVFYSRKRLHFTLGYVSPIEYERITGVA